jgi:hypothetical protein
VARGWAVARGRTVAGGQAAARGQPVAGGQALARGQPVAGGQAVARGQAGRRAVAREWTVAGPVRHRLDLLNRLVSKPV